MVYISNGERRRTSFGQPEPGSLEIVIYNRLLLVHSRLHSYVASRKSSPQNGPNKSLGWRPKPTTNGRRWMRKVNACCKRQAKEHAHLQEEREEEFSGGPNEFERCECVCPNENCSAISADE
ncbi:hypothetical protein ASZ78_003179 [Callipepla squamata]|uniref:Uncharacterized protein n=1 Tax=Callipepla squamata TaxID=9009 RepID=A0A226MTP6_CALSU|nr:hypothetical protein ASZ78_003179 [Callipepla squamata]